MTKMIKMSLVAAVAVAGLATTSTAAGFTTSGSVSYTMEKTSGNSDTNTTANDFANEAQHDIDYKFNLSSKVNDNLTANLRVVDMRDDDTDTDDTKNASTLGTNVDRAFFTYAKDGLKADFGLMATPFTDGERADGVIVSKDLGVATIVGGYLYTTGATNENEVMFAGVKGKAAMLGYHVAMAQVKDAITSDDEDLSEQVAVVNLEADLGPVTVAFDYGNKTGIADDADKTKNPDQSQMKLSVSGEAGMISYGLAYAKNGKDGGDVQIDGSDSAASTINLGEMVLNEQAGETSAIELNLGVAITATNSIDLAVVQLKDKAGETVLGKEITYKNKMGKNFSTSVSYLMNDDVYDVNELVLAAKYTF